MILVVNSGSSSIKFRLFAGAEVRLVLEGIAERIGVDGNLKIEFQNQVQEFKKPMPNHQKAVELIYQALTDLKVIQDKKEIEGIGFRVVHGGSQIIAPVVIDEKVKQIIQDAVKLAPLHNPGALTAIEAFKKTFPKAKLVACFDTAFHQTMPLVNSLYPLPLEWYEKYEVRKFGFHGISYQYVTQKMGEVLKKPVSKLNLVVCHLGNGASICAIKNGKSFNTTMGLTPLAGLMMGTRSGDIDPSILAYMAKQTKKDVFEITTELNQKSGLLGMSKVSSDMRDIMQAMKKNDPNATLAYQKYVSVIAGFVVQFVNQINTQIDGVVFTAGIGENSDSVRQSVIDELGLLKLEINQEKNQEKYQDFKLISTKKSAIPIYAVRTNEELMICQDTIRLMKK